MAATKAQRTEKTYYGEVPVVEVSQADITEGRDYHDRIQIDGVWYYLWDCPAGQGKFASRKAYRRDHGGNLHETREAPAELWGIARSEGIHDTVPCRDDYDADYFVVVK